MPLLLFPDYTLQTSFTMLLPFPPIRPTVQQSFRLQNTIAKCVTLQGFGFWTGEDVVLQFRPAKAGSGVVFVRNDLEALPRIPALVSYREEKPRQTSLVNGAARVDMVEHVLAAVKALQIDNIEIWTNRPEMPGFDGSSRVFAEALENAQPTQQPAIRPVRVITEAFRVGDETHYVTAGPHPKGLSSYSYSLVPETDYPLDAQDYEFELSPENFKSELAGSRTFLAKHEGDYLLSLGLCQRVTPKDVLVLTKDGPVDNEYRYENECARHKVLDMLGDFSLTSCDIIGTFESYRGSHSLNAQSLLEMEHHSVLLDDEFISQYNEIFCSIEEEQLKAA
ncbi:UDP-3-O-acyl-N-acetylglucosamine deacetylase [Planctomycetales bacterium]|nr:UDP-3-O-acyl-N-acetylglucosamine deacetylase [Planctomycetales bacterium]